MSKRQMRDWEELALVATAMLGMAFAIAVILMSAGLLPTGPSA